MRTAGRASGGSPAPGRAVFVPGRMESDGVRHDRRLAQRTAAGKADHVAAPGPGRLRRAQDRA